MNEFIQPKIVSLMKYKGNTQKNENQNKKPFRYENIFNFNFIYMIKEKQHK